jgi:ribonuclease PH
VQGTAEGDPFSRQQMDQLMNLANTGVQRLFALQREALQDVVQLPEPGK